MVVSSELIERYLSRFTLGTLLMSHPIAGDSASGTGVASAVGPPEDPYFDPTASGSGTGVAAAVDPPEDPEYDHRISIFSFLTHEP